MVPLVFSNIYFLLKFRVFTLLDFICYRRIVISKKYIIYIYSKSNDMSINILKYCKQLTLGHGYVDRNDPFLRMFVS